MRRVVFTAPLGLHDLQPELELNRSVPVHASSWIAQLSRALSAATPIDLHVITVTSLVPRSQVVRKHGVTHHVLSTQLPVIRRGLGLAGAHALYGWPVAAMVARIARIGPDLVHGHGTEGPFSLAAQLSGFPWLVSLQGIMQVIAPVAPTAGNRISARLEALTLRRARHVHCPSTFARDFVEGLPGFSGRTYLIEPPINPMFWTREVPQPARNVFFVGSVMRRKGVEDLIEAARLLVDALPSLHVTIVGGGVEAYAAELRLRIEALGLARTITFTGPLGHREILERFGAGGVFCLPSHIENSPNTIMEAMAAGLPVVASDVGGVSGIVAHGESGLVVPPREPRVLRDALRSLLENEERSRAMGERGRAIANQRWRPEGVAEAHLAMYEQVLRDSAVARSGTRRAANALLRRSRRHKDW